MSKIKYTLLIAGLIFNLNIHSQIGIQTDFPRVLFHIDGAKDNPQSGSSVITVAQQQNDITIDSNGRMGVGTISPQTKLHIEHNKSISGDEYGLKLTPGYGGPSILVLQNDGQTVEWEVNPSLGQKAQFMAQPMVYPFVPFTSADIGSGVPLGTVCQMDKLSGTLSLQNNENILIPTEGRYLLTFDMMGGATLGGTTIPPYQASIYIFLYKYDTISDTVEIVDMIEYYMAITQSTGEYMAFSTALYAGYCRPTDYLYIRFAPVMGFRVYGTVTNPADGYYTVTGTKPCVITIYNI